MQHALRSAIVCFCLAVTCLLVTACGGGGGGTLAGGGIGGTGITASGTITAFGSIFVNGIEFETAGATIDADGVVTPGDGSNDASVLGIGMVVTVTGTLNDDGITGTAETIQYDDAVQGPVHGPIIDVAPLTRSFSVLGVNVIMHKVNTVFASVTFDTLQADDLVDVSGFFDATGALLATRIERKSGSEIEVKGTVGGLAGTVFTLAVDHAVSTYVVDASTAELPVGGLVDNQYVEVKGTLTGNTIAATRIEPKTESLNDIEHASIEGIVTDFNGIDDFRVAGQAVNAAAAQFSPASLAVSIADGMEVEVEGSIQGGVLMADALEARGGDIGIGARVLTVAPDAGGLSGEITLQLVPGALTLAVDTRTTLRDDTGTSDPLTLLDIQVGDILQVTAYRDGLLAKLMATEIRREPSGYDRLAAPVDDCIPGSHIRLLGLDFALIDGTTQYRGLEEQTLPDSAAFCAAQAAGGFPVGLLDMTPRDGTADRVELED